MPSVCPLSPNLLCRGSASNPTQRSIPRCSPMHSAATTLLWETLPEPRLPQPVAEGDVRRLIAPDFDAKALYVNTPGVSVTRKGDTVVVKENGETLAEVRIKDLHHLAIFGSAQLSTALVQTLCERDVPISYFSMGGWFYGLTRGHGLSNVFTRIRQFARAGDADQALPLARLFVYGKIRNQRTLLMRNHIEPPPLALRALKHAASVALTVGSHASLLGIEGAAAMHYFQHFGGMIKVPEEQDDIPGLQEAVVPAGKPGGQTTFTFDFKTRNRRPPRDPVNALLSMAYSLLARDCTIAAYAVGFDPYIGLFHQPRFGRPALALDMMEEFRPLIADSAVLTAINNRMVAPDDFVQAGDAVNLSASGRSAWRALPLILLLVLVVALAGLPIPMAFSRHLEHEADRFGLELTHNNHAAATAFVTLQAYLLGISRPGMIAKLWLFTHPPVAERIEFCNTYRPWETGQPSRYTAYIKP